MYKWLVKRFIPGGEAASPAVRKAYGQLAGVAGVALNALLFCVKLPIGMLVGSISITSDAFNNLSDMGSSVISIISARLSDRRPDRDHPFGHGRAEYVSSLIISFLIVFVGLQLIGGSAQKLIAPEPIDASLPMLAVLLLGALVKLWMFWFNRRIGREIHSGVQLATARDSLNDCLTTTAVAASALAASLTGLYWLDGATGLIVALLVLKSGYDVARETIGLLLGGPPDPKLVSQLSEEVLRTDLVVGVHDLIVHDYGPGRTMASVHAEVPDDADIIRAHEAIDETEQRVLRDLGVPLVIHLDPIAVGCERTDAVRAQVTDAVLAVNPRFTLHDFRMTDGKSRVNVIFDLVVPMEMGKRERAEAVRRIEERLFALDPRYRLVAHIDEDYAGRV